MNIFWDLPGQSTRQLAETGDGSVFDLNRASLEMEGVKDISVSEVDIGGHPATCLDHAYDRKKALQRLVRIKAQIEGPAPGSSICQIRNVLPLR